MSDDPARAVARQLFGDAHRAAASEPAANEQERSTLSAVFPPRHDPARVDVGSTEEVPA